MSSLLTSKLGPRLLLIVFATLVTAGIWMSAWKRVATDRQQTLQRATRDVQNMARAFDEHSARTIQSADQTVLFLKHQYEKSGTAFDVKGYLKTGVILGDIFPHMSITDDKGMVVLSSQPFTPGGPGTNLADREHVRIHNEQDTQKLFVGKPVLGRLSGKWSIQMTRRANNPDGSLRGVVVVGVDPFYFSSFYRDVDVGRDGLVSLIGADGVVRARRSSDDLTTGQQLPPEAMKRMSGESGTYSTTSPIDGVVRILAFRRLANYPFYVVVGVSQEEVLRAFHARRKESFTVATLSTIAIAGFIALILSMASRVERSRTAALASATDALRNLYEHMGQAFVAFGSDRRLSSQASRQALALFGASSLEGKRASDLLYPDATSYDVLARAFDEWCDLAFETPPEEWSELEQLAPKEAVVGPDRRAVTLEFRPIVRDGKVAQVILLATDISVQRSLERTVETQEANYERRLAAMRRVLAGGAQAFVGFVESARDRLHSARSLVAALDTALPTPLLERVFRDVHTIRGEARAFDVSELEHIAERLEIEMEELRAAARDGSHPLDEVLQTRLVAQLDALLAALDRGKALFAEASPIGGAIFEQITVRRADIAELERMAAAHGSQHLREIAARLRARPFGEAAAGVVDSAPGWAFGEGKDVCVKVERGDTPVPPEVMAVLPGVLANLVRNAIAHGIERPEERAARGKPQLGTIWIRASSGKQPSFEVEDDGAGIDEESVLGAGSTSRSAASVAELIFQPGLSTRKTSDQLAGRGVGLDAVRHALHGVGYEIEVKWQRGAFSRFVIRPRVERTFAEASP